MIDIYEQPFSRTAERRDRTPPSDAVAEAGSGNGLDALLRHSHVWRAGAARLQGGQAVATGYPRLDDALPAGGWPLGGVVEILHGLRGIGELRLLLPALCALGQEQRVVACISPPHHLCVPAFKAHGVSPSRMLVVDVSAWSDALWAAEQALRSGACGAVLLWLQELEGEGAPAGRRSTNALARALRRLQLAAEAGGGLGVVFRGLDAASQASPAALRVAVHAGIDGGGPSLELLKVRGGRRQRISLQHELLSAGGPG